MRLLSMGRGANLLINIGHKAICRLPLVAARKVLVEITEADGPATLRAVEFHDSTGLTHQH